MNRQRLRKLFLDVDTEVAEQLLRALVQMERSFSPELGEEASLSCHRLRGDARTVGFELLAQLVGGVEDRLQVALKSGAALQPDTVSMMARATREIVGRMREGEDACVEPLSAEWLVWVDAHRVG